MNSHLKSLNLKLKRQKLDGLIVNSAANISYLTEYRSRDSYLIVSKKSNVYITDSRYAQEARNILGDSFRINKTNGSGLKAIAEEIARLKMKRVGFEERSLTFLEYSRLKGFLGGKARIVPTHGLVEEYRQIKSAEELVKIKKAVGITIAALNFAKNLIAPGKKELEIAAEVERFIRCNGASGGSFDIIVASGPNSSYPHHLTSERKIKANDVVLIDMGVDYLGYKSDLTRTFFLGKLKVLAYKVYDIVLKAQQEAIGVVRPGVSLEQVDKAARGYIEKNGYGGYFGHSLGHGVGLEVHEQPSLAPKVVGIAKPGMVFTIEPGIYLPGKFGVRIEDMVLVTKKGVGVISGDLNK